MTSLQRALARTTVALLAVLLSLPPAAIVAPTQSRFGQPLSDFAARRQAVRKAAGGSIVLLKGPAGEVDVERARFRTSDNLFYLTGVEAPGSWLALLPEGDPLGKPEALFLRALPAGMSQWVDPIPGPGAETESATGISAALDSRNLWETLGPSIRAANRALLEASDPVLEERLRSIHPGIAIERTAGRLIDPLRYRKSAAEVENLNRAIESTRLAQLNAARTIRKGATEIEVEGVIQAGFRKGGSVRDAFPSIVGSGPNSIVLHHFAGPRRMEAGEVVVVDIGAEFNYYAADVTRTYPVSGKFTPRQRELYQLVLDCQRACERYVQPGKTTFADLNGFARAFLRNSKLRARDSSGGEATMDRFFVHGLGHTIGLYVHDVTAENGVLSPGVAFTIEPGVYIASEGIGIRIEDDYLVTETGLQKLSGQIPSEVPAIERLMATRSPEAVGSRVKPSR